MPLVPKYVSTCQGGGHHLFDLVDEASGQVQGQVVYTTDALAEQKFTQASETATRAAVVASAPKAVLDAIDAVVLDSGGKPLP